MDFGEKDVLSCIIGIIRPTITVYDTVHVYEIIF